MFLCYTSIASSIFYTILSYLISFMLPSLFFFRISNSATFSSALELSSAFFLPFELLLEVGLELDCFLDRVLTLLLASSSIYLFVSSLLLVLI